MNLNTSELWSCYPQLEGRDMFRPFCILAFNLFGREGICLGPSVFFAYHRSHLIFNVFDNAQAVSGIRRISL